MTNTENKMSVQQQQESANDDGSDYRYQTSKGPDFDDIQNEHARRILGELEGVQRARNGPSGGNLYAAFSCRCPIHDDKNPSCWLLAFNDGGFDIGCHAGCPRSAILECLELKSSDLAPLRHRRRTNMPEVKYDYQDEEGTVLYQAVRRGEGAGKKFYIRQPLGNGKWKNSIVGVRQVPYHLSDVLSAIQNGETVYITEGEKDADRLTGFGLTATTNAMGSSKWRSDFAPYFREAHVVICADNDEPGEKHAQQVASSLHGTAAWICIVRFPDTEPKGDVSDWFGQGHTLEELQQRVRETPLWTPDQPSPDLPPVPQAGEYSEDDSGIFLHTRTRGGEIVKTRLTNFRGRIILDRSEDNGTDITRIFDIRIRTPCGESTVSVPASEFGTMNWVTEKVGADAVIFSGPHFREHVRATIQSLSQPVPKNASYSHTGWRTIGGQPHYLHGAGAITSDGLVPDIYVTLPPSLRYFQFPAPPTGDEERVAIRACLELLTLGPLPVTVSLYGAVHRVFLGSCDWGLHISGASGVFKTEVVALAMQHCGAGFDARHLPAGWHSTPNALEVLAFYAKDAPLPIDDFCPRGNSSDSQRLQGAADRLFRAQANGTGRGRLRSDASFRDSKPPRGIIISTGEDGFDGKSLNARVLTIELAKGDIAPEKLTKMQAYARDGRFVAASSGYIQWLAGQYDTLDATCRQVRQSLRTHFVSQHTHARTPEILIDIALGWRMFLQYAWDCVAITEQQRQTYEAKILKALSSLSETQATYQAEQDPARRFLDLVKAAITSQQAHVADASGQASMTAPTIWGWKERRLGGEDGGIDWQGGGTRIGYIDEQDELLYLDEDAALLAARAMARGSGDEIVLTKFALRKRLGEEGYLIGEKRGGKSYWTARVLLMGQRRIVLRIPWDKFGYTGPNSHNGDIPSGWTT
jgi:hypothetical protein